jgi:ferric-dicitrate binding protein FerR (iron transport regulator)
MRDPDRQTPAHSNRDNGADEAAVGELLRLAGKREVPPADFAQSLRASLREEWRAGVEERARRRQRWTMAGAAAAAVAVMGVAVNVWLAVPEGDPVARIVQVTGSAATVSAVSAAADQPLNGGVQLATAAGSRMALAFASGVSLRLDENTDVLIDSGEQVTVSRGAVYIDAGQGPERSAPLVVQTAYGNVRHLGTRYEVRVLDASLSVGVREGRVELNRDDASLQGVAGEQLLVSASGNVQRQPLAADASAWNWIGSVTPPYEIDNRPLPEFLAWAGRETGREVVFATPAAEAQAGQVVLKGSVAGLGPDQAIDAVLVSTTLRAERTPGTLTIRN